MPSEREVCAFELGIKLGAVFHQFVGTPVSPRSKASLERAMEEAIKNQPYVVDARVEIDGEKLEDACGGSRYSYTSLVGEMLSARVEVCYGKACFTGSIEYSEEEGFCSMSINEVNNQI